MVIGSIDFAVDVDADGKLSGICCSVFMYSVPTMKNTNKKNTISIMGIIMMVGSFLTPNVRRLIYHVPRCTHQECCRTHVLMSPQNH